MMVIITIYVYIMMMIHVICIKPITHTKTIHASMLRTPQELQLPFGQWKAMMALNWPRPGPFQNI